MANAESKVFISDIGLASVLLTLGYKLVDLEQTSEKRVDFVFAVSDDIEKAIAKFWLNEKVEVPIQTLFYNFRQLKNRLYAVK
ncbi:MAG: hypothetical protein A2644_03980 [Candidatus Zambryskibacteria bacterium RIFCSPHIGHO2_01_FULL_39_63]|nr:MAG: hypothetical protein A2644_03980 [Candidatus Zambryskibacteria bacterium RIFCSPHIGHO2_01_FULL_39_63]